MGTKYAIVTPVRDEEKFFPKTAESILNQEIKPQRWIIVDDGSRDDTVNIVKRLDDENEWITGIRNDYKGPRRPGGEFVLNLGMERLDLSEYDYFVRMDGDLSFDASYFRKLFEEFDKNPKLGIASGVCYVPVGDGLDEEKHPRFHTRGPLKTYRKKCFSDIGGLESGLGWDTVDEVRANMLGWQTFSFPELQIVHHRPTQTASGELQGMINLGKAGYYIGYHPLFMSLKAIKYMINPPYLIGGAYLMGGFLSGYLKRERQIDDQKFIRYLRDQQFNKMIGRETIWK